MFHFRRLIACLVALLLVLAQQSAFAHLIGHAGVAAQSIAQPDHDSGHDAALTLSHQCTTCLAFAALASPGPLTETVTIPQATVIAQAVLQIGQSAACQGPVPAYLSRAPPL